MCDTVSVRGRRRCAICGLGPTGYNAPVRDTANRWAAAEPWLFAALAVVTALPLLFVEYMPSGDGPEHVLQAVISAAVMRGDATAATVFEAHGVPPTAVFAPGLFRLMIDVLSPQASLRLLCLSLAIAMAFAVRALVPTATQRLALLPVPAIVMDVSFFKGFLNSYGSVVLGVIALAALLRGGRGRLVYAIVATATVIAHPFGFVLLGLGVFAALLGKRTRWRDAVLASIPSLLVATWLLTRLMAGQNDGSLGPAYFFEADYKFTGFFVEGWRTIAPFQPWAAAATFAIWIAILAAGRRVPWLGLVAFGLYLVTPDGMAGWSWISIRLPLIVGVALAIDAARVPLGRGTKWVAAASVVLVVAQAGLTLRAMQPLDDRVATYVRAGLAVAPGTRLMPITPRAPEMGTRVDVMLHAPAYVAMKRFVAYPEIFALDRRYHWVNVRPEIRAEVFHIGEPVGWHARVNHDNRAKWFIDHGGTALAFDVDESLLDTLAAAATATVSRSRRVGVFFRR